MAVRVLPCTVETKSGGKVIPVAGTITGWAEINGLVRGVDEERLDEALVPRLDCVFPLEGIGR
uniref:Uncharacterized protein n=1 Tax=Pristionchus pacificus TaxID=54126 RepID=A0A2A6BCJ9_PRIPA|eukprot:PDM63561.1 hypothetical protein PRIPAC_49534 [Pristionchus pacificus]